MMYEEFMNMAGYEVSYKDYTEIIEPMYNAVDLDKADFIKLLNRDRFELEPLDKIHARMIKLAKQIKDNCTHYTDYNALDQLEVLAENYKNRLRAADFLRRFYMNRVIRVFKGAEIPTIEGVLKVTDTTAAGLIYCNHYNVTEAGDLIFDTERRLTKSELAEEAWRVDGRVHDVNVINHYCDTCKHYIDEFFYNGSADCKKIDIMTEAEIDLYYTDAQPNCPHWEPMVPME